MQPRGPARIPVAVADKRSVFRRVHSFSPRLRTDRWLQTGVDAATPMSRTQQLCDSGHFGMWDLDAALRPKCKGLINCVTVRAISDNIIYYQ